MIRIFYRSWSMSVALFLSAILLYGSHIFIDDRGEFLRNNNMIYQTVIQELKTIKAPETYLPFRQNDDQTSLQDTLIETAKKYYLMVHKITRLPNNKLEIDLRGDLDSDIYEYLQDLLTHSSSTLSLQELGVFREQNHVVGKVLFHTFPLLEESGGLVHE